jgi:Fur family ferric uptake transcriptional regulator
MTYKTKQRQALLQYLEQHTHEELSAGEIAEALAQQDISRSAVYRNLSALEQEGKLRRSARSGSREATYRFSDCAACRACLHLKCTSCGKTFHMDAQGTDALIRSVESAEGFAIDRAETVLYGVCSACRK